MMNSLPYSVLEHLHAEIEAEDRRITATEDMIAAYDDPTDPNSINLAAELEERHAYIAALLLVISQH